MEKKIISLPVEQSKIQVPRTNITEVTIPESKPKLEQIKIKEVPVEESKIQVPQTKITLPKSSQIVIQNKTSQTKITVPKSNPIVVEDKVLKTQTMIKSSINPKVVEEQITIEPEVKKLQKERVNAKKLPPTKIQQTQNKSLSEVVAVVATVASQKKMQTQALDTLLQQQQVQTQQDQKSKQVTPQVQTPTTTPTQVQVKQNVQLDTVNKELQKAISNIPTVNVSLDKDNTAPSLEVVQKVNEFLIQLNSQHKNPTTITGGSPSDSDNLKILILNYIEFLQYLINTSNILRLSSLNTDELKKTITGEESIELTLTNASKITTTIDSAILLEFFYKFFYIDLTDLISRLNNSNEQNLKVLAPIVKKEEKVISVYVFIQILKDIANSNETAIKTYVYNIFSRYIVDMHDKKILDTYIEITEALNSEGFNC